MLTASFVRRLTGPVAISAGESTSRPQGTEADWGCFGGIRRR